MCNHIHIRLWDVITHTCLNLDDDLVKPPLMLTMNICYNKLQSFPCLKNDYEILMSYIPYPHVDHFDARIVAVAI